MQSPLIWQQVETLVQDVICHRVPIVSSTKVVYVWNPHRKRGSHGSYYITSTRREFHLYVVLTVIPNINMADLVLGEGKYILYLLGTYHYNITKHRWRSATSTQCFWFQWFIPYSLFKLNETDCTPTYILVSHAIHPHVDWHIFNVWDLCFPLSGRENTLLNPMVSSRWPIGNWKGINRIPSHHLTSRQDFKKPSRKSELLRFTVGLDCWLL